MQVSRGYHFSNSIHRVLWCLEPTFKHFIQFQLFPAAFKAAIKAGRKWEEEIGILNIIMNRFISSSGCDSLVIRTKCIGNFGHSMNCSVGRRFPAIARSNETFARTDQQLRFFDWISITSWMSFSEWSILIRNFLTLKFKASSSVLSEYSPRAPEEDFPKVCKLNFSVVIFTEACQTMSTEWKVNFLAFS